MKIGLVLGAGGIQGGAWLTGGLDALAEETGWDPAAADYVIGTSAGSMIGALCASGVPPWFMVAHSRGETFDGVRDAQGRPAATADRAAGARFELGAHLAADRPRLLAARASHPRQPSPLHAGNRLQRLVVARRLLDRVAQGDDPSRRPQRLEPAPEPVDRGLRLRDRPPHPLWPRRRPAGRPRRCRRRLLRDPRHLPPGDDRGPSLRRRRHLFGLESGPAARRGLGPRHLPQPDLHAAPDPRDQPPRRASTSSSVAPPVGAWAARRRRSAPTAPTLSSIQPTGDDLEAMGPNLMSTANRNRVIEVARRTVAEQLRDPRNRELLAELPKGDPRRVRRPEGPPSEWPDWRDQFQRPPVAG